MGNLKKCSSPLSSIFLTHLLLLRGLLRPDPFALFRRSTPPAVVPVLPTSSIFPIIVTSIPSSPIGPSSLPADS